MSDTRVLNSPNFHDAYLVQVEHHNSVLRMLVQRRKYSVEHDDLVAVWNGWIGFLEVNDVDARATDQDFQSSRPTALIDKVFNALVGKQDLRKARTARDLMREMSRQGETLGTQLQELAVLPTGYLLRTHLMGSYYIRGESVALEEEW